jgi:hypothetical protein
VVCGGAGGVAGRGGGGGAAAGGAGRGGGAAAGGGGGAGRGGGGAAAGGGAGRGGGAAAGGGGAGRGGGGGAAAGGGAGRGGGAAAGGAGRAGGGAAFGGALGLPSGPTSSLACATTIGASCACDGGAANCIVVRAVVANSTRRRLVMMVGVPGERLGNKGSCRRTFRHCNERLSIRPDCGGHKTQKHFIFQRRNALWAPLFIAHSGAGFKSWFHIVPFGNSGPPGLRSGSEPGKSVMPASVAG